MRVKCRPVAPVADPAKTVLVATGDSVTAAHEQQGFSYTICEGDTTADARGFIGSNGNFSYAGKYFDMSPQIIDYYNFARTGYPTSDIVGAVKDVTEDGCSRKWTYPKSPLSMAEDVVTNAKRSGYTAHHVTTGGINDTNWLKMLMDVTICRGLENTANGRTWYKANGGGGVERIVPNGGTCYATYCCHPITLRSVLVTSEIRAFDGNLSTISSNAQTIVERMLRAGADRVNWMLYYDLTPAQVDFAKFMRHFAEQMPGRYTRSVVLAQIPESLLVPLVDPAYHTGIRKIRDDINAAIRSGVGRLSPRELQRVRLVTAPNFRPPDIQTTAKGGSPHPSDAGHLKLATQLRNATWATDTWALRARVNKKYVSLDSHAGGLRAWSTRIRPSDFYQVVNWEDGSVALLAYENYHYVTAPNNGRDPLNLNSSGTFRETIFTKQTNGDGSISLKASNGNWVGVESGFDPLLVAKKPGNQPPGDAEKFDLARTTMVTLAAAANGAYVSAPAGSPLVAGGWPLSSSEVFRSDPQADGTIALLSYANDKYVSAAGPGAPLFARTDPGRQGPSETFAVHQHPDHVFSLSLFNGADRRFISTGRKGKDPLIAGPPFVDYLSDRFDWSPLPAYALRARVNNRFVTAPERGARPLVANRNTAPDLKDLYSSESFIFVGLGGDKVALFSLANNRWVTTGRFGNPDVIAEGSLPADFAVFQLKHNANGSVSLKAFNAIRWLTVSNTGALLSTARDLTASEEFDMVRLPVMRLRSKANPLHYITADAAGARPLVAAAPRAWPEETFYRVELDPYGIDIALVACSNGRYVSVGANEPNQLTASATEVGAFETFTESSSDGNNVTLKVLGNGNFVYVTLDADGRAILNAKDGETSDLNTRFFLVPVT